MGVVESEFYASVLLLLLIRTFDKGVLRLDFHDV